MRTFTIVERDVELPHRTIPMQRQRSSVATDREITADDVVTDHETRTAVDEAVEWLMDLFCRWAGAGERRPA